MPSILPQSPIPNPQSPLAGNMPPMVIIGVDPGSRVTGYGLLALEGNRVRCLDYGGIAGGKNELPERIRRIHGELCRLISEWSPSVMAVEGVFNALNVRSAMILGQTRGVVLLAAAQSGIPVVEYSALEVKRSVTGYGRADKPQVQMMVRTLLKLKQNPEPFDAADALAIALCHAFTRSPHRHSPQPSSCPR
jgi:crossover junction endodeoxyribonuclease RuvC